MNHVLSRKSRERQKVAIASGVRMHDHTRNIPWVRARTFFDLLRPHSATYTFENGATHMTSATLQENIQPVGPGILDPAFSGSTNTQLRGTHPRGDGPWDHAINKKGGHLYRYLWDLCHVWVKT